MIALVMGVFIVFLSLVIFMQISNSVLGANTQINFSFGDNIKKNYNLN